MNIKDLYQGLWNTVEGICDKRYLKDRPKAVPVDERPDSYIVICLPYTLNNNEISSDGSYNDFTTTIQLELYVRDNASSKKPNAFNVLSMSDKIDKVFSLFPIKTDTFLVTKPRITMQTDDGDGFAVTIIQGFLRTK